MLDLLIAIERRSKYLDSALPRVSGKQFSGTVLFTLPDEPWAEQFQGLRVSASAMPNLSERYGAIAMERAESPIVTLFRNAAKGETPRLDAEIELHLLCLPDCGAEMIEEFCKEWYESHPV